MVKLTLLLFIVIFLVGCNGDHAKNLIQKESKVKQFIEKNINKNNTYNIKRASNGVYIYTDRPHSTNINEYLNINNQIINN